MNQREERENNLNIALAINSLEGVEPSEKCMELMKDYIEGKRSAKEITEKLKNFHVGEV